MHSSEARASTLLTLPPPHGAKTFVSPALPPACADTQGQQQGRIHRGAEPAPARSSVPTSALTPDCLCWGVSDGDLCRGPPAAPRGPAPAPREPREAAPTQGATLESTQGSRGTPPASPSTGAESRAASERGEGRGPGVQRRCSPSPWLALLRPSLISIPQHPAPIRIFLIVLLCHYRKIHIMH